MAKHRPLPKTRQEWNSVKRNLVAIVEVDYGSGNRWLGFAYETGLLRYRFASGNTIAAQAPDVETAIEATREIAANARVVFGTSPVVKVHRVPATCKGPDGCLNKNIPDWLISIGFDYEIHEQEAA